MSAHVADWAVLEEGDRVFYWRLCRLLELGYRIDEAEQIAGSCVDVHALEALVFARGCPLELAAQILA
jgi:hypothetical protein